MKVPFHRHPLDASHAARVAAVLETPFLTSGDVGRGVEARLREFFDVPHALLTNSWTNGAVATLLALGVGPGHEVIVPAMTFVASANVAALVGARPVFVDVDPGTLLMAPEAVARALTPATRAVIPVHLYGQMVDVEALARVLAARPDVAIVEDAAHCFEGSLRGDPPGRHAHAAILSFYATKNVTCGEGGAVLTRDPDLAARVEQTRLHGMSAAASDRYRAGGYRHWDVTRLGAKANLPDLLAALLGPQIETIRARLPERAALCERYARALAPTPIRTVEAVPDAIGARHLFAIHVPPPVRDQALALLNGAGVQVTVNYRAVPGLTFYRERYGYASEAFPVSHAWGEGTISIPMFSGLTDAEQAYVIETLLERIVPLVERTGAAS